MDKKYIEYTHAILDAINFDLKGDEDFDNYLIGETKSFLNNKQSFLEVDSGSSDIVYLQNEIKQAYLYLSNLLFPKYSAIKAIATETRETSVVAEISERKTTNTYFEPVENGVQNEVKNNGTISSADEDVTTTIENYNKISEKMIEFFDLTKNNVERVTHNQGVLGSSPRGTTKVKVDRTSINLFCFIYSTRHYYILASHSMVSTPSA